MTERTEGSGGTGGAASGVEIRRHDDGVAELALDRGGARNAISTAQAEQIAAACKRLRSDRSVRVAVLTSTDPMAFCVGADLKERAGFSDKDLRRQRPVMRSAFDGVLDLPMPAIAAVHGHALGGGFELALACDLIVADSTAVFALPEVSVGLVPGGGGTQLLPRRVGWAIAADLIFTARHVDAAEAQRLGIADRLVDRGRDRDGALALAAMIAANAPSGVRGAKEAMRAGLEYGLTPALELEDKAWRDVAFSAERREGIAAFNEKRKPVWPT